MLKQAMMETFFKDLQQQIANMTPEDMERMKQMVRDLNQMLQDKMQGGEPDFDSFMQQYGDLFGPNPPQNLDELVEQMQRQMAQMQNLLDSLPADMRQQLQDLLMDKIARPGAARRAVRAGREPRVPLPAARPAQPVPLPRRRGDRPHRGHAAHGATCRTWTSSSASWSAPSTAATSTTSTWTSCASCSATKPPRRSSSSSKFLEILEEAGYIRKRGNSWELTPRGTRKIGQKALGEIYSQLKKEQAGKHKVADPGRGVERSDDTKPYEFGDPFHLHLEKTIMNALRREGATIPVQLEKDDFEVWKSEQLTQTATVMMVDLSWSMALRGSFQAAKKVAHGAAEPDQHAVRARLALHHRLLGLRAGAEGGPAALRALGRVRARHQHAPRADDGAEPAREAQDGHAPDHHDLGRRADGAPRARPLATSPTRRARSRSARRSRRSSAAPRRRSRSTPSCWTATTTSKSSSTRWRR